MKKHFLSIIFFLTAFASIGQIIADRQKMTYNPTTHILTLENSDPVDLSGLVGGSSTVTDFSLSGTTLSFTLDGGTPVTVDLSAISGSGSVKYKAADYTALSALSSPSTGDIAIVTGERIAGTFVYDSTLSTTDDGGVIINGWVRQYSGNVKSGWWMWSNSTGLQPAIDFVEANGGGTLELTRSYYIPDANIYISGDVEFTLLGNNTSTKIAFESTDFGIVVGNETTTTNKQVIFKNITVSVNNDIAVLLKIINHVRFQAHDCRFSGGLKGVDIYSTGSGNYGYDINFSDCDFYSAEGPGVHISTRDNANFMNFINFSACFFDQGNPGLKVERLAGEIQGVNVVNAYFDNADDTKTLLEIHGEVINSRFTNVTFDGLFGGVDQLFIDTEANHTHFKSCSFDGNVNNLSPHTTFDESKAINYFNSSRSIYLGEVGEAINTTASGTLTIPLDFDYWPINRDIELNINAHKLTLSAASGVSLNGVDNKSIIIGDGRNYETRILRKTGSNSYTLFGKDLGVSGYSTFYGVDAGKSDDGSTTNFGFGYRAMEDIVTGTRNIAIGYNAMRDVASNVSDNFAIGISPLMVLQSGVANFALGRNSLLGLTSGSSNIGIGYFALSNLITANSNTAVGSNAGAFVTSGNNTTGETSVFLGAETKAAANGQNNQIVIGYNTTGNGSNTVTIGNSSITNNYFKGNINLTGTVDGRDIAADGAIIDDAVLNTDTSTASMSFVVDDGTMSGNSATKVPTEQAVKAYVDANAGSNLIDDTTPQLGGSLDVNGYLVAGRDIEADGILLDAMDTPAERAVLYEALSNTNKYTDADKTKVGYLTVSDDADIDAIKVTVAGAEQWTRKMSDLSSPNNTNYPTTLAVVNAINASSLLPLISETTNQTAELTDANGLLDFTNGSDLTFTIPQNATVAFPVGTILSARRNGAGNITIAYSGSASGDTPRTYQYGETVSVLKTGTDTWVALNAPRPDYETITIALSDTSSDIVAGDDVDSFQIQYDMYVTSVSCVADVAGTTNGFEIDINENGTSILSTKLTTDTGEQVSSSASTPPVISDNTLSANSKISFDLTAVPTGAQRLKVSINGYRL